MTLPSLIWGSPQWMTVALGAAGRRRGRAPLELRAGAGRSRRCGSPRAVLKALGFAALALSLLEPLLTGSRPRRGANAFVDPGRQQPEPADPRRRRRPQTRGDWLRDLLRQGLALEDAAGAGLRRPQLRVRLAPPRRRRVRRPDVRRHGHVADDLARGALEAVPRPAACRRAALHRRQPDRRRRRRLVAAAADLSRRPAVAGRRPDVGVSHVSISQTNFESAPVVVRADVSAVGSRASRSSPSSPTRPARTSSARKRSRPATASR